MQQLNWTKPLETNRNSKQVELVSVNSEVAVCRVTDARGYREDYQFNPTTGVRVGHEEIDDSLRIRNTSEEVAEQLYQIWFGYQDWSKEDWRFLGRDEFQFSNPKDAAAKAKELNAEAATHGSSVRFMIKPYTKMTANHKWKSWMLARFASGEYTKLPWADEPWAIKDHFAHPSLKDPFSVAYIPDAATGVRDTFKVLTPGRYLTQYYADKLNPQEISQWAVRLDNEAELLFATTPDEIEHVYTNSGISSCMAYRASHFSSPVHPVRVYGAGDLELAYLKRRNKIIARVLVRRSNMKIQRIYGDAERIKPRLQALGFDVERQVAEDFYGARILRIPVGSEMVMPYIDWSMMSRDNPNDPNTLLLCSHRDPKRQYNGGSTNGVASGRTLLTCAHDGCNETFTNADPSGRYVAAIGRSFCGPCATTHTTQCGYCENHIQHDVTPLYPVRTRTGSQSRRSGRDYVVCRNCVSAYRDYEIYEGSAYARDHGSVFNGVWTPHHVQQATPTSTPPAPVAPVAVDVNIGFDDDIS